MVEINKRKLSLYAGGWSFGDFDSHLFLGAFLENSQRREIGHVLLIRRRKIAYIDDSELSAKYCGKGLGKLMYIEAINAAFDYGCEKVISDVGRTKDAERVWLSL